MSINCTPTSAKTQRVFSATELDITIQLSWGVQLQRRVCIAGFDAASLDKHELAAAKHCLIVLVGGKKLWIHPLDIRGELVAHVYLIAPLTDTPSGWTSGLANGKFSGLELGPYLTSLQASGFNIDAVHTLLNGRGK